MKRGELSWEELRNRKQMKFSWNSLETSYYTTNDYLKALCERCARLVPNYCFYFLYFPPFSANRAKWFLLISFHFMVHLLNKIVIIIHHWNLFILERKHVLTISFKSHFSSKLFTWSYLVISDFVHVHYHEFFQFFTGQLSQVESQQSHIWHIC